MSVLRGGFRKLIANDPGFKTECDDVSITHLPYLAPRSPYATSRLYLLPKLGLPLFYPNRNQRRKRARVRLSWDWLPGCPLGLFFDQLDRGVPFPRLFIVLVPNAYQAFAVFFGQSLGSVRSGLQRRLGNHGLTVSIDQNPVNRVNGLLTPSGPLFITCV